MNAREQLKKNGQFDKEMAVLAGQQTSKKLRTRISDYKKTVADLDKRNVNSTGFHCPGSQKK